PPRLDRTQPRELYQIGRNAIAEGIAGLPKDYGQIRQATPQPAAGNEAAEPAQAAVQSQQSGAGRAETGEAEAGRAERQRRARQALLAREAGLLFVLAARPAAAVEMAGRQELTAPPPPSPPPPAAASAGTLAAPNSDQQHKL